MGDRQAPQPLALVQELVNTLDVETGADGLASPGDLDRFTRENGLTGIRLGTRDIEGLRELREALRAACLAHTGGTVPQDAGAEAGFEAVLERKLSRAPLVLRLGADGTAALRPAPGLTGLAALTAQVAAGIAAAAADGTWERLKACEAHDCLWVYYDRSPGARRRWCRMDLCGSRAKMRAYRARRGE
ncbi:CGNR zinc finger domain-containing protein [Streptomyces iconiensis]|uniref:CGNR zinc finger domain-containing protein n=1 Tax=Streptomyces iconiensis TaxID=1384038 RepID=A0ABT7A926_9ACTN|nr:CGNR zinc finger domain-containing protein [Streptomyces iconiensis]MDJ1137826.1 CGNR zinc finger domain-containing protein [Streptomyces iconiensis]